MTDADSIPAGFELDCLVAQRVMGWLEWTPSTTVFPCYETWDDRKQDHCAVHRTPAFCEDWQPSTNIAHAWEVVERMRSTEVNWFTLNWYGDSPVWYAVFGDSSRGIPGDADTAPLAICRAALAAMACISDNPEESPPA